MEAYSWCKELWTPETFNRFTSVANVVWIVIATAFVSIFLDIEINESRFATGCALNSADADGNCFVEYEGLDNKLFVPLYSFVIVNFSLPFVVCVIYSVFAKPRVSSLVNRADVERGQNETVNSSRQRKLFIAYFSQLITIIAKLHEVLNFHVIRSALQNSVCLLSVYFLYIDPTFCGIFVCGSLQFKCQFIII